HDNTVIASDTFRADTRYDAYDRLRQAKAGTNDFTQIDSVLGSLADSVRVQGSWFYYDLSPRIIDEALGSLAPLIDSRFTLPATWVFPHFSLGEFHRAARLIWVLAYLHFNARLFAIAKGCEHYGYARALYTVSRSELLQMLRRHATLSRKPANAIVETLTF